MILHMQHISYCIPSVCLIHIKYMLECYLPDGTDRGKGVILLQILLTKGAMLVVDLHKKSVVGDLTSIHETGGLRITLFSKIGNKISFFWISKLNYRD